MTKLIPTIFLAILLLPLAVFAKDRPNIVFILVDDLGWSDVGFNGAKFYETPNMDGMAKSGMKFNRAYSGGPNCLPSRAALISGMYTPRTHTWTPGGKSKGAPNLMKLLVPMVRDETANDAFASKLELEPSVISIAEVLKTAGYRTARFGKWHLGTDTQGFDISDSNGKGSGPSGKYYGQIEVHQWLTDASCKFIEDNMNRPFFLYLSHWDVHIPLKAHKDVVEKYNAKYQEGTWDRKWNTTYAAMIEAVDKSVGQIRDKLKELELDNNTLFIFSSDNGGYAAVTSLKPLRGAKGAFTEGGVRVPTYMVWPSVTRAGSESNTPITSVDFLPTFAALAQAQLPQGQPVDGVSILPLLKGEELNERSIFWHNPLYLSGVGRERVWPVHGTDVGYWRAVPSSMIVRGDWKLIHLFEDDSIRLYDLADDIGESRDLSKEQPEVASDLFEELKAWQKETSAIIPAQDNPIFGKDVTRGARKGKSKKEE